MSLDEVKLLGIWEKRLLLGYRIKQPPKLSKMIPFGMIKRQQASRKA